MHRREEKRVMMRELSGDLATFSVLMGVWVTGCMQLSKFIELDS